MKASRVLKVFCAVIICLLLLCLLFPKKGVKIGSTTLRFPTLHKVLVREKPADTLALNNPSKPITPAQPANTLADSVAQLRASIAGSPLRFWFPNDDFDFFNSMFASMEAAQGRGRTIRVMHFGDSQIEMDRMTCELRAYMQEKFGGSGPGMLPLEQTIPSPSVRQQVGGDFVRFAAYGKGQTDKSGNYGPMVINYRIATNARMVVQSSANSKTPESFKHFSKVKVVYNDRQGGLSADLNCDLRKYDSLNAVAWTQTTDGTGVGEFVWLLEPQTQLFRINFKGCADIYAVMVDGKGGVAVDNIPMRGCSGSQFSKISSRVLKETYAHLDAGLVILQFGGNSVPYIKGIKNISAYASSIGKQVDIIRAACPQAKVLFIGPSDMSTRINGEMQSYPCLEPLIAALRDTVTAHGAAYWSIYHAMGGNGSMVAWHSTNLAGNDFIHFTPKGASIMGERLSSAFDQMYNYYLMRNRMGAKKR